MILVKRVVLALFLVSAVEPTAWAQSDERLTGGTGTLYLGSYPQQITVVDEATEQVIDTIHVTTGVPRNLTLSPDRSRFYLNDSTFEWFEVIDVARRETVHSFTLSERNRKARIRAFTVHPNGRHVVLVVDAAVKLIDRFEIEDRKLLLYDLEQDEVVRELTWPDGHAHGSTRMLFSPDGRFLYHFAGDVTVFETENYTEVNRWVTSEPIESGLGRLGLNFTPDLINEEPGFFTGIVRVEDEIQNRELMGIARIDLRNQGVDLYTLGPAVSRLSFALAPGRQKAYGVSSEIGYYEFWVFDLERRRVETRQAFQGRPRMDLNVSTNGRLLYISQAGETIDLYNAETLEYLRTITLDGDQTTRMLVVP